MNIRLINENDYDRGYYELLDHLTDCPKMSRECFQERLYAMASRGIQIYVIHEFTAEYKIIGTASLIIEPKFIHGHGLVAHIEDVVIDPEYRGQGLGRLLIKRLIKVANGANCYKVILNCSRNNIPFYEKLGFSENEVKMNIYYASQ